MTVRTRNFVYLNLVGTSSRFADGTRMNLRVNINDSPTSRTYSDVLEILSFVVTSIVVI